MRKNLHFSILFFVCILFSVQITLAQDERNPGLKTVPPGQAGTEKSSSKLSQELRNLYNSYLPSPQRVDAKAKPDVLNEGLNDLIQVIDNMVLVDITIMEANDTKAKAELEKIGLKVNAMFGRVISGMMPIEDLPKLESATKVRFVHPAYKPMHQGKPVSTSM
ncbi:MAG: hypothetical protein M3352_02130, partial [Bacteroidota bacterium]|nr:hypothetical protein [Bacteroidota bacterium]